jgi:competence ComEA-like helix-hairpin-helix protein
MGSLRVAVLAALFVVLAGALDARGEEAARIDLNTASAAELESLPGVGPSKAQAILAHREVAPFKSTEELIEVKGIGDKLFAQLKDRVTVSAGGNARKAGDPAAAAAPADAKTGRTASAAAPR